MPNTLKFRCRQVNTQLHNEQRDRLPVTTISFQIVANDPANSWMRNGDRNNGSGSFSISTTDPIAAIGFRVGRDYRFSIEEWDYPVEQVDAEKEGVEDEPFSATPQADRLINAAERRRDARAHLQRQNNGLVGRDVRFQADLIAENYNEHHIDADEATESLDMLNIDYEFGAAGLVIRGR